MNYWLMSRHVGTPPFHLFSTGLALAVYAGFVRLSDSGGLRVGLLRTLGQNPLVAYLLDGVVVGAVSDVWPTGGGWPTALAGALAALTLTYLPVRLLERRRIFLRL
jgi:predicted acyltransferase